MVNNLTTLRVDNNFIKKTAEMVLFGEKKSNQDISLVLVSSDKMQALNQQYRRKNKPTDVLTFPELDIVICPKVVKENAQAAQTTFKDELARVVIHGVLHWLDYDHEIGEKEAEAMSNKEAKYFKKNQ